MEEITIAHWVTLATLVLFAAAAMSDTVRRACATILLPLLWAAKAVTLFTAALANVGVSFAVLALILVVVGSIGFIGVDNVLEGVHYLFWTSHGGFTPWIQLDYGFLILFAFICTVTFFCLIPFRSR